LERTVIGLDNAGAAVDEEKLVPIGVAGVERHRRAAAGDREPQIGIAHKSHGPAARIEPVGRLQLVEIKTMGAQVAFETNPARGRVGMVQMGAAAFESPAAVLFLERPFREAGLGLAGGFALCQRIHPSSSL
jgi:hypothetical protein